MMDFFEMIPQDYLIWIGFSALLLGILFFLIFLFRRIRRILNLLTKKKYKTPGIIASLRNLVMILFWLSVAAMILFAGFFLRAYQAFTLEKPVASVFIEPLDASQTNRITLTTGGQPDSQEVKIFLIRGDQWMLEGDVLQWDNWMNFLGLHTRYRFTRIRGRYLRTSDEIRKQTTVYSLIEKEEDLLWKYLYRYGHHFPLVNSVYGNAVFQSADSPKKFQIFVSTSGFTAKEIEK